MSCLSLAFIEQLLVYCVVLMAAFAIIRLVVPWALSKFGGDFAIVGQVINIILWCVVIILIIYIVFALLACLMGGGGLSLLPPHPGR
jgi:hypothetical protein